MTLGFQYLIYVFSQQTFSKPDTVLGVGDLAVNKADRT